MTTLRPAALVLASAFLLLPACDVGGLGGPGPGGGGGGGADAGPAGQPDADPTGPDAAPPDYALLVPPTAIELSLGKSAEVAVTITSARFAGPVTLSADGFPATWNVSFQPSNVVDLSYDGNAVVTMRIDIPTDGEAANTAINVTAVAAPGQRTGSAPINVANELTLTISSGTGGGAHPFPVSLPVRLGTSIKFVNSDGTPHRIHSNSEAAGFAHEEGEMNQGQSYSFTFTDTGEFGYYCHIHDPPSGVGSFLVTAP